MTDEKGWYWLAAAVLALGVSNSMARVNADWFGRIADRTLTVADRVSRGASNQMVRFLAAANLISGRGEIQMGGAQVAFARVQTKIACVETTMARGQTHMAQLQAQKLKVLETGRTFSTLSMRCPRQGRMIRTQPARLIPDDGTI